MVSASLGVCAPAGQIRLRALLSQSLLASFQFDVQWEGFQLVNDTKGQGGITSMTGYATREGAAPGFAWTWEVRSVNARGLDIRLRLPDGLGVLEAELAQEDRRRGRARVGECHLAADRADDPAAAGVDPAALNAALDALMQVRMVAEQRGIALAPPTPGRHPEPARDE
jgi:hypothetical protein